MPKAQFRGCEDEQTNGPLKILSCLPQLINMEHGASIGLACVQSITKCIPCRPDSSWADCRAALQELQTEDRKMPETLKQEFRAGLIK